MSNHTHDRYRAHRKDGVSAKLAWHWAQDEPIDEAPTEMDGFDLTWEATPEFDNDNRDWLGKGGWIVTNRDTGQPTGWVEFWKGSKREMVPVSETVKQWSVGAREDFYFIPAYSIAERARDLNKIGYSKSVALDMARAQVKDDAERFADHTSYVVTVTASKAGIELGEVSVGGVEADDEDAAILWMAGDGLADEAVDEARDALERLGVDSR